MKPIATQVTTDSRRQEIISTITNQEDLLKYLKGLSQADILGIHEGFEIEHAPALVWLFYRFQQRDDLIEAFNVLDVPGTNLYDLPNSYGVTFLSIICQQYTQKTVTPVVLEFIASVAKRVNDINQVSGYMNYTAAHHATKNRLIDVLEILMDHGADLGVKSKSDKSCDDIAKPTAFNDSEFYLQYLALSATRDLKEHTIARERKVSL